MLLIWLQDKINKTTLTKHASCKSECKFDEKQNSIKIGIMINLMQV